MSADIVHWRGGHEIAEEHRRRIGTMARALNETRYRLRNGVGAYVHGLDFARQTTDLTYAWIGFKTQLKAVRERHPELRSFAAVSVPPEKAVVLARPAGTSHQGNLRLLTD